MTHVFWRHPVVPDIRAQFYARDRLTGTDIPASGPPPDPAATLWVDSVIGNDGRSKATVTASGGTLPWATIGRAVWGNASRSIPTPSEAAAEGDVVSIAGSSNYNSPTLYTTSVAVNSNSTPVYLPANSGSVGNYITFRANGYVKLGAPAANAPVVGVSGSIDYIKWIADRADSRFIIVCDGRGGGTNDTKADTSVVNTRPDTGPVFIDNIGVWIEGFDIDGGPMIDYGDNWDGIRVVQSNNFVIRNNWIHDFRKDEDSNAVEDTSHNQTGITLYGAQNGLIEHNLLQNNGSGIYFKDTITFQATTGNTVRYNWFSGAGIGGAGVSKGVSWSLVQSGIGHGQNVVYQNVFVDLFMAFSHPASSWNDDVYNNTIARTQIGFDGPASCNGDRVWNNIVSVTQSAIYQEDVPVPTDTTCDFEHNCYFGASPFMEDSSGSHTFAAYLAEYPSLDQAAPASVNSDPLFTNAAADDFTLQAGSPARNLALDIGSGAHAGAYQTGLEEIGLET